MGRPYKKKVAACILRKNSTGQDELLVHFFGDDLSLPPRLPGGGAKPDETPEAAIFREILEETGLTQSDLHLVRKLGVSHYFKSFIQADVERHDFLLRVPDTWPDEWSHFVTGGGEDEGACFLFRWLDQDEFGLIDPEHHTFLTSEHIPELFK